MTATPETTDIAVNGTYWAGAFLGTIITLVALNRISPALGWRIAYVVGPVLALVIIFVRKNLPESPRWQIMHGHEEAAEASIAEIEGEVRATKGSLPDAAGNLLGPLTIGRLFDTIGRRKMIAGTYLLSGVLLVVTAQLFKAGVLNAAPHPPPRAPDRRLHAIMTSDEPHPRGGAELLHGDLNRHEMQRTQTGVVPDGRFVDEC